MCMLNFFDEEDRIFHIILLKSKNFGQLLVL